jgi:hypothetical protein
MVNQNKSFARLFISILVPAAIIVLFLVSLSGCSHTKNLSQSSSTVDQNKSIDSSYYWKKKALESDSIATELKKEMNADLEFEEESSENVDVFLDQLKNLFYKNGLLGDTLDKRLKLIFDSIKRNPCKNSLTTNADGSFTATGLKRASLQLLESNKKIELLSSQLEEEINKRIKVEDAMKTVQSQKVVVKKTSLLGFLNQWWWILVLGVTGGFVIGFRICWKYKDKIRADMANTDESHSPKNYI